MQTDLRQCRVPVTPTTFGKHDPELRRFLEETVGEAVYNHSGRPLQSSEVAGLLHGCDGYIAGLDIIDRSALEGADRLKVIARYGVGVDRVDLRAAADCGITVTNTPDANSASVAELTIGMMLVLARDLLRLDSSLRGGGWPRASGLTLEGKTVGLIGLGNIGRQVAIRLQGWGTQVLGYDPGVDSAMAAAVGARVVPLEDLLRLSDIVSLHVPVLPQTRGMVNSSFLAGMKTGACIVNTARGELVDEAALASALITGRIRAAALDAFVVEPPAGDNPLLKLSNVIVTPHCGAHTDGAAGKMGWSALQDCLAVLRGESPKHPVVYRGTGPYA